MNKRPSFQFYPADWRKDPQLQMCDMTTQGIWINILCCMWEANEEGKLEGSWQDYSQLLGITVQEFKRFYIQAKKHKFADVTNCNGIVTIINRRMNDVFLERERAKKGMRVHRAKQGYDNVTLHSSTSSSTSKEKEYKEKEIFDIARKEYPGTKRGLDTEFNYFCKHPDWKKVLLLLSPAIKQQEKVRADNRATGRFNPPFKNFKTWIYNRCWEQTVGVIESPEETATKEQQALEKKKQEIRSEYSDYYRSQTTEQLQEMSKANALITHRWLIKEIIAGRKDK